VSGCDQDFWEAYAEIVDAVPEPLWEALGRIAVAEVEQLEQLERRVAALEARLDPVSQLEAALAPHNQEGESR
jgi:BMFP domain-containing protein YqiC